MLTCQSCSQGTQGLPLLPITTSLFPSLPPIKDSLPPNRAPKGSICSRVGLSSLSGLTPAEFAFFFTGPGVPPLGSTGAGTWKTKSDKARARSSKSGWEKNLRSFDREKRRSRPGSGAKKAERLLRGDFLRLKLGSTICHCALGVKIDFWWDVDLFGQIWGQVRFWPFSTATEYLSLRFSETQFWLSHCPLSRLALCQSDFWDLWWNSNLVEPFSSAACAHCAGALCTVHSAQCTVHSVHSVHSAVCRTISGAVCLFVHFTSVRPN